MTSERRKDVESSRLIERNDEGTSISESQETIWNQVVQSTIVLFIINSLTGRRLYPWIFSVLVWLVAVHHNSIFVQRSYGIDFITNSSASTTSLINTTTVTQSVARIDDLVPKSLYDSYQLGCISEELRRIDLSLHPEYNTTLSHQSMQKKLQLLTEARDILHFQGDLSVENVTEGVPNASKEEDLKESPLQKLRGAISFIGIISIIATLLMVITLVPALIFVWEVFQLQICLGAIINILWPLLKHLIEPSLYVISLLCFLSSFQREGGSRRTQMSILAAMMACVPFFLYNKNKRSSGRPLLAYDSETVFFLWIFSFIFPMAWSTGSRFLGFFSIGCAFGFLGFIASPMPFGWVVGFEDKASLERCMVVSILVIMLSISIRLDWIHVSKEVYSIFKTGMAVFGMVCFGLAGLIKSGQWSGDNYLFIGGFNITTLLFPTMWLFLGYIGSTIGDMSLKNSSITFVILWMSQYMWRLVGIHALSMFCTSLVIFLTTMWLQVHPDFLKSLIDADDAIVRSQLE